MDNNMPDNKDDWECPADVINGNLGYQIVFWDDILEYWSHWGFATTAKGAETKQLCAKSKGCLHVRVFQLTEILK